MHNHLQWHRDRTRSSTKGPRSLKLIHPVPRRREILCCRGRIPRRLGTCPDPMGLLRRNLDPLVSLIPPTPQPPDSTPTHHQQQQQQAHQATNQPSIPAPTPPAQPASSAGSTPSATSSAIPVSRRMSARRMGVALCLRGRIIWQLMLGFICRRVLIQMVEVLVMGMGQVCWLQRWPRWRMDTWMSVI